MGLIRGAVKRGLGLMGYDLVRLTPPAVPDGRFYRPHASCQIPSLSELYEIAFDRRSHGTFVEVGGYDGESHSNVAFLGDLGWHGVIIEPVPAFAEQCRRRHSDNPGVTVIEAAAGAAPGHLTMHVAGALSTANEALFAEYKEVPWAQPHVEKAQVIKVVTRTLDDILEEAALSQGIDVMSIDVEGYESEVFAGFTVERWTPQVLIVEITDMHPDLVSSRDRDRILMRKIELAGYDIVYKDSINTVLFYQHRRDV